MRSAISRAHENGLRTHSTAEIDVTGFVAHDPCLRRIEAELRGRGCNQRRARLATLAVVVRSMRTDVDAVQEYVLGSQQILQAIVDLSEACLIEVPASDSRLVRDHDQMEAGLSQTPKRFGNARK